MLLCENNLENAINFDFIYDYTKDYYCQDNGRPCLDTVILFKIVLINFLFGINSIRKTIEEIKVNMAYRWFFINIILEMPQIYDII
jgi:transposase